jgi:hypothetical protein
MNFNSSKQVCLVVNSKKYYLLEIITTLPDIEYDLLEIRIPVNMFFFQILSLPDIDLLNN